MKKLALVLILFPLAANAETLPPELIYKKAPVDPNCFAGLASGPAERAAGPIDLAKCTRKSPVVKKKIARKDNDITYSNENGETTSYKYIGQLNAEAAILVTESGSGSGIFDGVYTIKRQGDVINTKDQNIRGDRCNGGIGDISVKDGKLAYAKNITPADFVKILDNDRYKITGYESPGLEMTADSCFGAANYLGNELISISIDNGSGPVEDESDTKNYKYQSCFNKIYNSYLKPAIPFDQQQNNVYRVTLSAAQLKKFIDKFDNECVTKAVKK